MVGGPSAAMEQMSAEERNDVLTRVITEQIADVLGLDPSNLEIDEPLQNMGFDSLMAVELQVAIEKTTGHSLQRMELLSAGLTAADLVCVVSGSPSPSPESLVQPPEDEEIDFSAGPQLQVDDLSDADVDALLNELATAKQL